MFGNEMKKQNELIAQIKAVWESGHSEEMAEAYNEILGILANLDIYSANILVNLLWLQTAQKTFSLTVGKKEMEVKK
jgi:hypothetical protein